jgi:hypothetical protein
MTDPRHWKTPLALTRRWFGLLGQLSCVPRYLPQEVRDYPLLLPTIQSRTLSQN